MSKTFGVGILGCGFISTTYLDFIALFKGLEIRAVADIAPEMAESQAKKYRVEAQTVDQLLANPDVDIVVNLTIPEAHYQTTKAIAGSRKHAYSEKPLVLSVEQGLDLKACASKNGVEIGCAPDTFLGGSHQQARHIIDSGQIGAVTSGTCHVLSAGMESWHPNPDFFFRPGGGPVLDLGPYYVANLINLLGPVGRVSALASAPHSFRTIGSGPRVGQKVPVSTPTTVHAVLEFVSGALITLGASWDVVAHNHSHMELYGSDGSIFVPDPNFFGGDLVVTDASGKRARVTAWDHPLGQPNQKPANGAPVANYRAAGLAEMAAAIRAGLKPRCSLATSLHGVDIMTSILKSAKMGSAVDLITSCERPLPLGPKEARALLK